MVTSTKYKKPFYTVLGIDRWYKKLYFLQRKATDTENEDMNDEDYKPVRISTIKILRKKYL